MTKTVKRKAIHKVKMALYSIERNGNGFLDSDAADTLALDAIKLINTIENEYDSKNGAGAIWLNNIIKDTDKLTEMILSN